MRSCDVVSRFGARARAAVVAAAVLAIAACSDSHGSFGGGRTSTETGNPPVIDVTRVALVVSSDEVHVTGEPGAVTPGGGEVVIEAVSDSDVQRGPVGDDGSFDVIVAGSLYETYVLRATGDDDAGVSEPVYLNRGGASVGVDGGVVGLSCDERHLEIIAELTAAEASASRACDSNSDCSFWPPFSICPHWACEGAVVSEAGRDGLDRAIAEIETSLCVPFERDGCFDGLPVVDCAQGGPVACVAGQCTNCRTGACPETSCAQCETPDVSWSSSFGGRTISGPYSVTDCATFTHEPEDGATCSSDLPCIGTPGAGPLSAAQLQNALGHPDVIDALAANAQFGARTPAGAIFAVRVGDGAIDVYSSCEGTVPPCIDPPEGVSTLRALLEQIATQQACESVPEPACTLPFDPGEGPGTIFVYAFHAQTGTCVPQVYTGVGGNANRFDDLATCRASCPNTATADGCPPNRTFIDDLCLECGPVGGCTETAPACAKLCTTAADCAGEPATCSGAGLCNATVCI